MAIFTYTDAFGDGSDFADYIDEDSLDPVTATSATLVLQDDADAGFSFEGTGFNYFFGIPTSGVVNAFSAFNQSGADLLTVEGLALQVTDLASAFNNGGLDAVLALLSAGRDTYTGSVNDDIISAGAGVDRVRAGGGADTITGGRGNDVLDGNGGGDHFVFRAGHGSDRINGFTSTGSAADDHIVLTRALYRQVDISDVEQGALLDFGDAGSILLVGVDAGSIGRGDFIFG